jgi:hypothetical protein
MEQAQASILQLIPMFWFTVPGQMAQVSTENYFTVRVDHKLSDKDSLSAPSFVTTLIRVRLMSLITKSVQPASTGFTVS